MMKKQLIACSAVFLCLLTLTQCREPERLTYYVLPQDKADSIQNEIAKSRPTRSPADDTTMAGLCQKNNEASSVLASLPKNADMVISAHPGGRIFYKFDESLTNDLKTRIRQAMDDWEVKTGAVEFINIAYLSKDQVPRRPDYHVISYEGRAVSPCGATSAGFHGRVGDEPRTAFYAVFPEDVSRYVIRHELGHMIGLAHELQRSDASRYIKYRDQVLSVMNKAAVASCFLEQHVEYNNSPNFVRNNIPFNANSVMMYDSYLYGETVNKDIWTHVKKSNCQAIHESDITEITEQDVKTVQTIYAKKLVIGNELDYALEFEFTLWDDWSTYSVIVQPHGSCFVNYNLPGPDNGGFSIYHTGLKAYKTVILNTNVYELRDGKRVARKMQINLGSTGHVSATFERFGSRPGDLIMRTQPLFSNIGDRRRLLYAPVSKLQSNTYSLAAFCTVTGFIPIQQRSRLPSFFPNSGERFNRTVADIFDKVASYLPATNNIAPVYFVMILAEEEEDDQLETLVVPHADTEAPYLNIPKDNGTEFQAGNNDPIYDAIPRITPIPPSNLINTVNLIPVQSIRDELRKK